MAVKRRKATKAKRKSSGTKRRGGGGGLTKMTYGVSEELAEVVGTGKKTRPQIVKQLWAYIKRHKCQDTKNRRMIVPDKKLAKVIGSRPVDMLKLAGALSKHIKKA